MKVLFLNPWDMLIGPNRYLIEMLRRAPDLADQSTVVFHENNNALREYADIGCKVLVLPEIAQIRALPSFTNLFSIIQRHIFGLWRIIKLIRTIQPDVIISNTEQLMMGNIASRILGLPHIKIFHALTFTYRLAKRPKIRRAYLKTLTLWTNYVIAVSDTLNKALLAGGIKEEKVVTVPNPIPIQELKFSSVEAIPLNLQNILYERGPILLSAGHFSPRKGQDQLVEALPEIREHYPKMLCIFAGKVGENSGFEDTRDYYQSFRHRIAQLSLDDNVFSPGEINYLPALMRRTDIYIHTSRTESFGRTIAEAYVCDTPVIAYNVGALEEVAGPGAVLVKAGDTQRLAKTILGLLSRPDSMKQMASAGYEHIEKLYDAKKISNKFVQFLLTLNNK